LAVYLMSRGIPRDDPMPRCISRWADPTGTTGDSHLMAKNVSTFRRIVTRWLAAGALLCIYCFSVIGTRARVGRSSTTADAEAAVVVVARWRRWSAEAVVCGRWLRGGGFRGGGSVAAGFVAVAWLGMGWLRRTGLLLQLSLGRVICPYS